MTGSAVVAATSVVRAAVSMAGWATVASESLTGWTLARELAAWLTMSTTGCVVMTAAA
jgi:hypothetical protein